MKVTMDDVLNLIETVSDSNLTKFQFEDEDFSISMASSKKRRKIKKIEFNQEENKNTQKSEIEQVYSEDKIKKEEKEEKDVKAEELSSSLEEKGEEREGKIIYSPLVGTFYSAKEEGAEPFVKVGDTVKKGQVIGIIEAMKLMNEVESEYDGIVSEILVKNEEMVEYNQPLVCITEK